VRSDSGFRPRDFLNGARMAYEMIVMAFADGDRKTLKNLLSKEVYEGFDAAISEREKRGEVVKSTFVGIDKADIVQVVMKDSEAQVTVRIVSQLISATFDKAGALIEGDQETVAEVTDIWTFARDIRSRDPNWKLIATESEQ
jgi:predicted lipid-binding transport protein (Tim44 family)